MTDLVISSWNGRIRSAIEYGAKKNPGSQLAEDVARVELTNIDTRLTHKALRLKYATQMAEAAARRAA